MINISKELLELNGFEYCKDSVYEHLTEDDLNQLHSEGYYPDKQWEMRRTVVNQDGESTGKYWFISMRYNLSNTPGRDWFCHIDSCAHSSVAFVDIGTVEQFNKLMDVMDIEFRLK